MGGDAPSFQVLRLDLPTGSDYLGLGIGGRKSVQVVHQNEKDWHLSSGIVIVNAETRAVGAYWIWAAGAVGGGAPPHAVVEIDGTSFVNQPTPISGGVMFDEGGAVPPGLPPGVWYAIGFGIGGGEDILGPTEWRATVISDGISSCEPLAVDGEMFDFNQTHFSGGTQIYASGLGIADNIQLTYSTSRRVVAGLMLAGAGTHADAELNYTFPESSGRIHKDIAPLSSTTGPHHFDASYQGYWPNIVISGVAFDT